MRNTFLAVDASTDLPDHARALRRVWEATFSGRARTGSLRPVIAHSWSRMTGAGLHPDRLRPRAAFTDAVLADARAASPLRAVLPALRSHLGTIADDAEHVMVVCDGAARVLWLEGHPRVLDQARHIDFRPGMSWEEASAGTNAIGTALSIDHPVQVFSAEHFLPEQHTWWCSAAPIHDPMDGALLGVVDVSGPQRTAHPYSLTLVTAAARIAGDVLREQQVERDNRLREAYLDRLRRSRGTASALVDARGRVLMALPGGWLPRTVGVPSAPGRMVMASGATVEAEPLDDAWVLWVDDRRAPPARRVPGDARPVELRLLGRHGHLVRVGGRAAHDLTLRHAEALALLVLYPDGLTANELTLHLYGESGKAVTTRSLMSRLRALLGGSLLARPYRLVADVHADFLEVGALLRAGEVTRALRRYRGPLLAASEVERIVAARAALESAVRRAALDGTPETVWAWLDTDVGGEDVDAMRTFLALSNRHDVRRDVVAGRLLARADG